MFTGPGKPIACRALVFACWQTTYPFGDVNPLTPEREPAAGRGVRTSVPAVPGRAAGPGYCPPGRKAQPSLAEQTTQGDHNEQLETRTSEAGQG